MTFDSDTLCREFARIRVREGDVFPRGFCILKAVLFHIHINCVVLVGISAALELAPVVSRFLQRSVLSMLLPRMML